MLPPTCVDYALLQLSEFEAAASYHELGYDDDDLYDGVRDLWKKACLGDMPLFPKEPEYRGYGKEVYCQGQSYKREVMFLKMIIWGFATWDDDTDPNLKSLLTALEFLWVELGERIDDTLLWKHEHEDEEWDLLASFLEGTIQQSKSLIVDYYYCHLLSDSPLQCRVNVSSDLEVLQLLQLVLHNLEVLVNYKADLLPTVKIQIDSLVLRVNLSCNFFRLITTAPEDINSEELRDLKLCLENFAKEAASLAFLFWAKSTNEQTTALEAKINQLLSDMWHNIIKPCGSVGTPLYLAALKTIKLQLSGDGDTLLLYGGVVEGFVDLHLHKLVPALKDDCLIFIFLFTFMANPPQGCDQDEQLASLCNQIDLLFRKYNYLTLSPGVFMEEDFTMDKMLLSDFGEKFEEVLGKVKQLCVRIPGSRSFNFPRTNGLGFYDFLLQNLGRLKDKLDTDSAFIPYAKKFIIKIEQELVSFRPLVNDIFELQKRRKELEDTWSQVVDLAYRIEHVTTSCLVAIPSIWYNIACLSDILDEIEDVKGKSLKVANCRMQCTQDLPLSLEFFSKSPEKKRSSTANEEVICHEEVTREIIEELIWGNKSLGIISIIGMGGLGKTTLAKEVLNSESVRRHFHKVAFCTVSQVLNAKRCFTQILCDVTNSKADQFVSMTEEDLAHHLWKCLSGQKYLIVMDDIWDTKACDEIKRAFPDSNNGSRIIFTTREGKVALDAKSILHDLPPLSVDESIKLLHMKVFGKDACPPVFSEVGKIIATNCKGLPLSVVVVAGLLTRDKTSPSWWEEIAKATSRFAGQECRDIIGLSYKYLPEHLKSCLLYMGIFEEDEVLNADELRQLWIGEGFVNKSLNKSFRSVAKEHLSDLVEKNLVTDVARTGRGGIKECRLHDLIHDFCRRQAKEDKFIWFKDGCASSNSSNSTLGDWYRVYAKMDGRAFDDVKPTVLRYIHSLLCLGRVDKLEFIMGNLRLVQVLHLEMVKEVLFCHHLVHLRYLYIGQGGKLWEVPESICNLWNLEILIFRSSLLNKKLPKTIWKMKMLRHLEFTRPFELDVDDDEDEGGHQLLENLEFLSCVILYDETSARRVLRRLPNIQKLICILEGSQWKGKVLTIDSLSKLESLELNLYVSVLDVTFPSSLKRLECYCDVRRWKLEDEVGLHILSRIGRLADLEVLKWGGYLKQWNVEDDEFQKLKHLRMSNSSLEQWNVSFDSFSCLEQLQLSYCSNLEEVPARFTELPTLQKIKLKYCNDKLKSSAIQAQKEHKECGNEMKALKDLGLDVVKGTVSTEASVKQTKFFITHLSSGRKVENPDILERVRLTIINNLLKYHPESSERLAMGEAFGIKAPDNKPNIDVATHINVKEDGPARSLLYIETADRPGLLLEIVKILDDINVNVESAEIDTEGLVAKDKFHVSYRGQALNSSLSQVLTNCLRYYLRRPETDEDSY